MKKDIPDDWKSIYIMQSEYGDVKIGISKNVDKRKRTIENNRLAKITNCYKTKPCSNAYEIETAMHKYFSDKRIHGEWFSCDMGVAIQELNKMFSRMAKFDVKDYSDSFVNAIAEVWNARISEEEKYVKELEKTVKLASKHLSEKNEQIERLISMVEQLQDDAKKRNRDMEDIEEEYYYLKFLLEED